MTLIEVKNLNKIYGSGEAEVKALKNINLNIEQGEFVAIVGQSGSGKSTLLHLIGGVDIPSSGEVIIDGRALANKPSIILADEPTGNLDSKNSKEVLELLKYCAKKYNQTLILITHDINIAKSADRVITIEDGEIISDEVIK